MEFFFTSVKPYFKNILNLVELPVGSIFYTTQPFGKKLVTVETWVKKSFLTVEKIFSSKFKIMQWNGVINRGFLNGHLLKVSKLLVFVLFSLFIISNIMVKTFFQEKLCFI